MTEAEFNALSTKIAGSFVEAYAEWCNKVPKQFVLMAMTGALAACAAEAGASRENVVAALKSALDDIEGDADV